MLEISALTKSFNGIKALQNVTLSIDEGKVTSLIGPNGSGKTTLFNVLSGFLRADAGEILFNGRKLTSLQPWQIARLGMGRTFQELRLFRTLTVQENVLLGMKNQRGENVLNALFKFSAKSAEHKDDIRRADACLDFVELNAHRNQLAEILSYGQKKLLSIASCLAGDPQVLLLDEPVAGLYPKMRCRIENLLRRLVVEKQVTLFIIEHDRDFAFRISDTVVYLKGGKIEAQGSPDSIRRNRDIQEA
jgi:branched-chain amino acid transport system ATP-binding protein